MRGWLAKGLPYLVIVGLTGGVVIADRPFWIQLMIGIFITGVLALAWDMLSRTGQVSLGMAAFFGIGTYTTALIDPIAGRAVAWIAVIVVCAAAAILLGVLTLRLRHMYFAIATLGFSLSLQVIITAFPDITGGSGGVAPPVLAGGEPRWQLVAIGGLLLLATATSDILLTRRFRPAFFMIRSKPELAAASGVPVVRSKITAFVLSGIFAGLAGACYGGLYGYVVPGDVFTSNWSIMPLAIAVLGGMDTTAGPLLGAIVLRALEELARVWVGGIGYQVVYGAVIIAFVLALPRGLIGFIRRFVRRDPTGGTRLRLEEGGVRS
jgi:branched-chain amino acid transport system permease protein